MIKVFGIIAAFSVSLGLQAAENTYVFKSGHPSLQSFVLGEVEHPSNNQPSKERIALGAALFFDPRLSGDGNMSCASCHNPALGWSDGLPTARGVNSSVLSRSSPTIFNTGYNSIQMWDGRKKNFRRSGHVADAL